MISQILTKDLSSAWPVRIKALGQECDMFNRFRAILAKLTSNLFTSTVAYTIVSMLLLYVVQGVHSVIGNTCTYSVCGKTIHLYFKQHSNVTGFYL